MQQAEWLKQDIDKLRAEVKEDFKEVNGKLDSVLKFKWQIMGGTAAVATIIGIVLNLLIALAAK